MKNINRIEGRKKFPCSKLDKGKFPIRKKETKYSNWRKENIPIRKRDIFQIEKGKYSNLRKENIPIKKWKIFPI